ncbi:conserved hypothetical protein [Brochothrix thermosphacta]|nr:conserved hypothetical protein [Brochothrix thermosphacta]
MIITFLNHFFFFIPNSYSRLTSYKTYIIKLICLCQKYKSYFLTKKNNIFLILNNYFNKLL